MSRGGKREGAGRKKGFAALEAEKQRHFIARKLVKEVGPIVTKAIELAKLGDRYSRDWLFDRAYGKASQLLEVSDPDGTLKTVIVQKYGADSNNKSTTKTE